MANYIIMTNDTQELMQTCITPVDTFSVFELIIQNRNVKLPTQIYYITHTE